MNPKRLAGLPIRLTAGAIWLYKAGISPFLGPACRFHPTCSEYALDALRKHGLVRGSRLAASRLLRCNPWCRGGLDPA